MIGHARIMQFFTRAKESGRLSHAYCFTGPAHVGKRAAARQVASLFLGVLEEKLNVHPDVLTVARLTDEKTDAPKRDIVIDQMQDVRTFFSRRSAMGKGLVAMIDDAEHLNASAANALLKTLEEPAGDALIILLATDASSLPKTILSRCQEVAFAPVPEAEIAAGLEALGVDESRAKEFAQASRGLPGLALQWASDPPLFAAHQAERAALRGFWGEPLYKKRAAVEDLLGEAPVRDRVLETLAVWECEIRDALLGPVPAKNSAALISAAHAIRNARQWTAENVNTKLLVEHILLTIP